MFAAITPALALGASAERTRIVPAIFFLFLWSTFVYDFVAYWNWAPNGWLRTLGALDFAGGSPVHISSGASGLALAYVVGKRHGYGHQQFKPHNLSSVFLGTALLWFGWFGFNGGSALAANSRAIIAVVNSNLAACAGGLTWVLLDYYQQHHFSAFGFCSGAIAGLVSITPAAGFVYPWAALIFGVLGAICCELFIRVKHRLGFDDALDAFGVHGVGGLIGGLLTGIFASKQVASLDGTVIPGGWIDGNYMQLVYQLCSCICTFLWAFVVTFLLGYAMNHLPYMGWRLSVDEELQGVDRAQMNAGAYDYIEVAVGEQIEQARSRKTSGSMADLSQTVTRLAPLAPITTEDLEMNQLK
jgi:Amt family ammonium transporter